VPQRTDLERLNRKFQVVDRTGGRREMKDAVQIPLNVYELGNIVFDEMEALARVEMLDVFPRTRNEVVHPNHVMAVL
jgi:hypothetical protein